MGGTAFIFPGQGSQSVGMLAELAKSGSRVETTFREASEVLGRDLWKLVCEGPADELNQTRRTQPAMLAADIAAWRMYRDRGGRMPLAMAGHSLGEYAALVAAGSLDFAAAVGLVHQRGRLMQEAVAADQGAMAAILGLDEAGVESICRQVADEVVAANYNAPGQVVIAGRRTGVEQAVEACRQAGARRAVVLPVSVPAHSPLMEPAKQGLRARLQEVEIRAPECPVLHNLDLKDRDDADAIRCALVEQLTHPVPWTGTIRALAQRGAARFVECGPGRVLAGLGRRIDRGAAWVALDTPEGLERALAPNDSEASA